MLRKGFIGIWWWLLIVHWRWLLPRGLIKSLWLLPSLIVPTLMPVLIVISSSCNIIVTRLIAMEVRTHDSK
ncbi:hypothetical protein AHAS_Ahas11G0246800 [Arachis hypogaea]